MPVLLGKLGVKNGVGVQKGQCPRITVLGTLFLAGYHYTGWKECTPTLFPSVLHGPGIDLNP